MEENNHGLTTPYVIADVVPEVRSQIYDYLGQLAIDNVKNMVEQAFKHSYRMTAAEHAALQHCFPSTYVLSSGGRLKDSSHPVLAALNDYANDYCRRNIDKDRSLGLRTMTIGDSADRKLRAHHNCLLLNNSRDLARVAASFPADDSLQKYARGLTDHTASCIHGCQNCTFAAHTAYAVHSMYDVTMEDVARTFAKHGLERLTAFLYIPPELLHPDLAGSCPFFRTHKSADSKTLFFTMGDYSRPYGHDVKTWRAWVTTSVIRTVDFDISIEHLRTFGPMHQIVMHRVRKATLVGVSVIPLRTMFDNTYLVPDILEAVHRKFYPPQEDLRHFRVTGNVAIALTSYCQRTNDEAYKFHELATYASGLRRNIVIGGKRYQDAWDSTTEEYYRVVFSFFILGAIQRTSRTQGISAAFKFLQQQQDFGFIDATMRKLRYRFERVFDAFRHDGLHKVGKHDHIDEPGKILWDYRLIPIEDLVVRHIEHVHIHDSAIATACNRLGGNFNDDDSDAVSLASIESVPAFAPRIESRRSSFAGPEPFPSDNVDATSISPSEHIDDTSSAAFFNARPRSHSCETCHSIDIPDDGFDAFDEETFEAALANQLSLNAARTSDPAKHIPERDVDSLQFSMSSAHTGATSTPTHAETPAPCTIPKFTANNAIPKSAITQLLDINTDPVDIEINNPTTREFPRRFLGGHCAMRAFHDIVCPRVDVQQFIHAAYDALMDAYVVGVTGAHQGDDYVDQIASYIFTGRFDNNVSSDILPLLARRYAVNIDIISNGKHYISLRHRDSTDVDGIIYHTTFGGGHYSSTPRGGSASAKYAALSATVISASGKAKPRVLDISCAPGQWSNILHSLGCEVTAGYYTPGLKIGELADTIRVLEYDLFQQLFDQLESETFDIIINDCARPVDSESILAQANALFINLLAPGGTLLSKSFANPTELWHLADLFYSAECALDSAEHERYFMLTGYKQLATSAEPHSVTLRREYLRPWTNHPLPFPRDLAAYTHEFFHGEFAKYKPYFNLSHPKTFSVSALTGVASAAKTSVAIKHLPGATFIAPSRELSMRHQSKGVKSFTPHAFFADKSEPADIVVDEISQFPVHYLAMVALHRPRARIHILGDIYQTPYVNFQSKRKYATVRDYGVRNNLTEAHAIPQDICTMIRMKHNIDITTTSDVKTGFCKFVGDIAAFAKSKIPVIAFNDATVGDLRNKGLNAHTITTYTGSRSHTVIFYIDSASVASKLVNRTEWMYTAMSRATNQLVVAGDTNYLEKFYCIQGANVRTYDEINQIFLASEPRPQPELEIPITIPDEKATCSASLLTAETILSQHIIATNDPNNEFVLTANPVLPAVESGRLRTNLDVAANPETTTRCYKLSHAKVVKNQVSNSTEQTLATLIKRYSKNYRHKPKPGRDANLQYTQITRGLSKAVYGNDHSFDRLKLALRMDHDEIALHTRDYLDKLQEKMNANPSAARDLQEEFDELNESLQFFNKRQCKFDPKTGFDTSDKVGQGIAATSKRLNVLFGCYARALLDRLRQILKDQGRHIILATHDSEAGLNDLYTTFAQQYRPKNWACNDFSEWDSCFRATLSRLTRDLIVALGCPPGLAEWFLQFRMSWIMTYRSSKGTTKLAGREKQFSGNPFTIAENTIANLALCFTLFEYTNFKFGLFKGDDSAVACDRCDFTKHGADLVKQMGYGLKLHHGPVGEFAGWFLTDSGFFPDVLRYAAKFIDKNYRDQKHFDEAKMSVRERLSAVKNESQVNIGIAMCHRYYNEVFETHISTGDIYNVYAFLLGSRNIHFEQLRVVNMPNLNVKH